MNMIKKITILFSLALFTNAACAQQSDFDRVCGYFKGMQKELAKSSMTNKDKAIYITKLVNKNLKVTSPARETFELVMQATAEVRYELYQTSAQEVTKAKWECAAMQKLLPTTGEY